MPTEYKPFRVSLEANRSENYGLRFTVWLRAPSCCDAVAKALLSTEETRKGFAVDDWRLSESVELQESEAPRE